MIQCVADGSWGFIILSLWFLRRQQGDDYFCRPPCGHDGADVILTDVKSSPEEFVMTVVRLSGSTAAPKP